MTMLAHVICIKYTFFPFSLPLISHHIHLLFHLPAASGIWQSVLHQCPDYSFSQHHLARLSAVKNRYIEQEGSVRYFPRQFPWQVDLTKLYLAVRNDYCRRQKWISILHLDTTKYCRWKTKQVHLKFWDERQFLKSIILRQSCLNILSFCSK